MAININDCPLKFAVLHDTNAIPTDGGKLINLKGTLDPQSVEGKSKGLKLTLLGPLVSIEVTGGRGLIPTTNFKMLVPAN